MVWDIGIGDQTTLWFGQRLANKTRLVGYCAASGESLKHYVDVVNCMARERGWQPGDPLWPHRTEGLVMRRDLASHLAGCAPLWASPARPTSFTVSSQDYALVGHLNILFVQPMPQP